MSVRLVKSYLHDRIKIIVLILGCGLIWQAVFSLYHLEAEALHYALLLTFLYLLGIILVDFFQYQNKHQLLKHYLHRAVVESVFNVDHPTLFDEDYQMLIASLQDVKKNSDAHYNKCFKELEDYFTMWAHQIKLPIAALKLLLETEEDLDKRMIKTEVFRIDQYTDMAMAYLRMTSDHSDYVFSHFRLDDVIRQVIRKFSTEFIRKKIRLDYKPISFEVLSDEKWLMFVLEQIVSNALKYTKQGSIMIYALNG